jgi:hypothetical protein
VPLLFAFFKSMPGHADPDRTVIFFYVGICFIAELAGWMLGYALGILLRAPGLVGTLLTLAVGIAPAFLGFGTTVTTWTVITALFVISLGWGLHGRVRAMRNQPPEE